MKYRIVGDTMPAVEILFDSVGESVFTQSGGMTWMSDGIAMATNTRGGLMKGIGRMVAGESLFMAYTAQRPGALIAFAATVAGQIYPLDVGATGGMICQKGAFLCAQNSVNVNISFTKKISSGFFGGEGFILQDKGFRRDPAGGCGSGCLRTGHRLLRGGRRPGGKAAGSRRDPEGRYRQCGGL